MSSSSSDNHEGEIQLNADGELIWQDTTRIQAGAYGYLWRIDDGTVSLRPNDKLVTWQQKSCCCPDLCGCNAARAFGDQYAGGNGSFTGFSICGCTSKTIEINISGVTSGSYNVYPYNGCGIVSEGGSDWSPNGTHCLRLNNPDSDYVGYERDIFVLYYVATFAARPYTDYTTDHTRYYYQGVRAEITLELDIDCSGLSEETGGMAKIMGVLNAHDGYASVFSTTYQQVGSTPVSGNMVRLWKSQYENGTYPTTPFNPPLNQNNDKLMTGICDPAGGWSGGGLSNANLETRTYGYCTYTKFQGYGGSASFSMPSKTPCKSCLPIACPDGEYPYWNCVYTVLTWLSSSTDNGDTWSAPYASYTFFLAGKEAQKYPNPSTLDYGYGFTVRIDWNVWKISQGIQGNGYCQAVRYQMIGQADAWTVPDLQTVVASPPPPVAPGTRCTEPQSASSSSSSSQSNTSSSSSSYSSQSQTSNGQSDGHLHGSNPDGGLPSASSWSSGSSNSKSSQSSHSGHTFETSSSSERGTNPDGSDSYSSHSSKSSLSSRSHSTNSSGRSSPSSHSSLSTPIGSDSDEGECTCFGAKLINRASASRCADSYFLRGGDLKNDADGRTYSGARVKRKKCHRLYIWDSAHHDGSKWIVSGTPTVVRTAGHLHHVTAYDGPFYVDGGANVTAPYWDESCGIGGWEILTGESWTPTETELTRAYNLMHACGTVPPVGENHKLILYVRFTRTNTDLNSSAIRLQGIHATCSSGSSGGGTACCTGTYTVTATGDESSTYTMANNSNSTWGNFGFASSGRWTLDIAPVTDDGFPWEGKWRLSYSNDVTGIAGQWTTPVDLATSCVDVSSWTFYEYPAADGNTTGFTSITLHCNAGGGGIGDNSSSSSSVSSHSSDPEGCIGANWEYVDYMNNRGHVDPATMVGVDEFDARGYRDSGWMRTYYTNSGATDTWYRVIFVCEGDLVPTPAEVGVAPRSGAPMAARHSLEAHPAIANRGSGSSRSGTAPTIAKGIQLGDSRPLRNVPKLEEPIDPRKMPSAPEIVAVVNPQLPKTAKQQPCGVCRRGK